MKRIRRERVPAESGPYAPGNKGAGAAGFTPGMCRPRAQKLNYRLLLADWPIKFIRVDLALNFIIIFITLETTSKVES